MAESKLYNTTTNDLTECGICLMTIEEPKALPCLHSFCLKCLSKWAEGKKDTIRCPICSQDFPIPPEGIKGFITNFVINTLKDRREILAKLHAKDARIPCSCCGATDSKVEGHCTECGGFICVDCGMTHRKLLILQDHSPIPFGDLQSGKVDIRKVMKQQSCKEHKGQDLQFYCKTCGVLICHACTVVDHPVTSHCLVNLKHATKEQRSEVKLLMADCSKVSSMVVESLEIVDGVEDDLNHSLKNVMIDIQQAADVVQEKVAAEILRKKTELELKSTQAAAVNKKQIEAQKESLQVQQTRLQTALQIATEVTQIGSDHDLALVFSSLKDNMSQLRSMKPGTVDRSLGELKFTTNETTFLPDASLGSLVVGFENTGVQPSPEIEEFVEITDTQKESSKSSLLRSNEGSEIGTWKLIRQVGEKGPQKVQNGFQTALTLSGDFIVADVGMSQSHGQVLVFDQSGYLKFTLDTKQGLQSGQLSKPWNVVVSQDGRIFITHWVSHVNVYGINGTYKYRFPTKSPSNVSSDAQVTKLCGLALDNRECLLVGDVEHKYISKHRLDGSHLNTIRTNIPPGYISVTSSDKLVVSNGGWSSSHSVHILDPTGPILHTLKPSLGVAVWHPSGICCTADDDIHISNSASESEGGGVYCYTSSGQYKGCITKEVSYPAGLALTDNDNKLIVVDVNCVKLFSRL